MVQSTIPEMVITPTKDYRKGIQGVDRSPHTIDDKAAIESTPSVEVIPICPTGDFMYLLHMYDFQRFFVVV